MQYSRFTILNLRFANYLVEARRAAYISAMRSLGRGDEVSPYHDSDWQKSLVKAQDDLAKNLDRYPDTPEEVVDALWMCWGLTNAYTQLMAETAAGRTPLKWQAWLNSPDGQILLKRFPQDQYEKLLKDSLAEINYAKQVHARYTNSRTKTQPQVKHTIKSSQSDPTTIAAARPSASSSGLIPSKQQSDKILAIAESLYSHCGVKIEDNRRSGGALWINYFGSDAAVLEKLQSAGFRFHPKRGWWSK